MIVPQAVKRIRICEVRWPPRFSHLVDDLPGQPLPMCAYRSRLRSARMRCMQQARCCEATRCFLTCQPVSLTCSALPQDRVMSVPRLAGSPEPIVWGHPMRQRAAAPVLISRRVHIRCSELIIHLSFGICHLPFHLPAEDRRRWATADSLFPSGLPLFATVSAHRLSATIRLSNTPRLYCWPQPTRY